MSSTDSPPTVHPPVVERLRIAVRERPASDEEVPLTQVLIRADQDKLIAFAPKAADGLMYDFDYFYPQNARQADVFCTIGLEMVDLVMGGLSANCIAIGYAETGKTHTLFGSPNESGLIQDTVRELFRRLEAQRHTHEYSVGFSYWEMNCNSVLDNLAEDEAAFSDVSAAASSTARNHAVYRDGFGRLYLSHMTEVPVKDFAAFETLLGQGNERRVRRGYARQFRWHGFVQLSLMTLDKHTGEKCVLRRVTFVHTKGSERVGANRAPKHILREGSQVNVSSTLLNAAVIHSLEYRAKRADQCRTQAQLHRLIQRSESFFMECRYTQVMSQLMCGHEACFVVGCVDPLSYSETTETLEILQLYRNLLAACVPVVTLSERGRLLRQLRAMETAMGGEEMLQFIYFGTSGRPRTEQEEALLALRGKLEMWGMDKACETQGSGLLKDAATPCGIIDAEGRSTRKVVFLNAAKTATYEGQWKGAVFDGFGEHIQANFKYRGEFRNGRREGHGTLFLRDTKESTYRRVYEGEWLGGQRDGRGTQWGSDGEVYEGDFAANERQGLGKLYLANGDVIEGNFSHNKCEGWAVLRQTNGDWFEGYWMNGEREGPGVWHYVSRQRCLRGEWHHNKAVMGTMEDDADKIDDSTGPFIPRLQLLNSEDILAQQRKRLIEKRRLEFSAAGKTWVDYAAMNKRCTVSIAATATPMTTSKHAAPADGHTVYGLEIE